MSRNNRFKPIFAILVLPILLSFIFVGQLRAAPQEKEMGLVASAPAVDSTGGSISLDANGKPTALQAQTWTGTRIWYLDNVRFDSGAVATGSFRYNTEPYNPIAGQYGTFSDINVNVTSPNGTVREFRIVNPVSRGNARYISFVAATGGDLTGAPFMALTPAVDMTNAGGVIDILPGPQ
ncbi:MAG: hypothetical protein AAF633_11650, partial [Chloroflexota bacterium]